MYRILIKITFGLIILLFASFGFAEGSSPGFQFAEKQTVSLSEYLATQPIIVETAAGAPEMQLSVAAIGEEPEILELARGLRNDPNLIYKFVHDHIDFIPTFYGVKGAYMTLMDRSGNSFDQSSLMVALLKAAEANTGTSYSPRYVLGVIDLTLIEAGNWLGIANKDLQTENLRTLVKEILDYGRIICLTSADPNGPPEGRIILLHMWVRANIGGTDYVFDPSLKEHRYTPGIDIKAAMGYNRDNLLTSVGGDPDSNPNINSISNISETVLSDTLTSYVNNLINYIKTNIPDATLKDMTGGKDIIPVAEVQHLTSLEHEMEEWVEWTSIPFGDETNSFSNILKIEHCGIEVILCSSDIYGRTLSISYNAQNKPELRLDGELVPVSGGAINPGNQVGLGTTQTVTLTVYPPDSNSFTAAPGIVANPGNSYIIVNGWNGTSPKIIDKHRGRLTELIQAGEGSSLEAEAESLAIMSYSYMAQCAAIAKLCGEISNGIFLSYHSVGICGDSPYIDLPLNLVATGRADIENPDSMPYAFYTYAGMGSVFESGIIEQLQPENSAVSTVKLLDVANSSDYKIYKATVSDWNSIEPLLQGYSSEAIIRIEQGFADGKYSTVILPARGDFEEGVWHNGYGYLTMNSDETSLGFLIKEGYNGGWSTSGIPVNNQAVYNSVYKNPVTQSYIDHSIGIDPIDLVTGDFLYNHSDISIGTGGFPFSLGLERSYNSGRGLEDGPLGLGWTHNFDITAKVDSDGFQTMGADSPIDAASAIVALSVSLDLEKERTLKNIMVATMTQKWLMDQMIDNIVTIKQPGNTMQFIKLPDGSYNPPPRQIATLTKDGSEYEMKDKNGNVTYFNDANKIEQWKDIHNNLVTFSYAGGKLDNVINQYGCMLDFSYTDDRISSVTPKNTLTSYTGSAISYAYNDANELTTFTDQMGNDTDFVYDPNNDGRLTQVFYPANPSNPYVTNVYSELGRVETQTNANNKTYDYYYSYYRSEEVEPDVNGLRSSSIYYFDDNAKTIATQDQLGNIARYEFDAHQRQTAVIYPKGNATLYSYDKNHNNTIIAQVPAITSDLVGYWKFDEGIGDIAYDNSLAGDHNGTINGADWVSGKLGGGLAFDGNSNSVSMLSTITADDSYSVSLWFKSGGNTSTSQIFEGTTQSSPSLSGNDNDGYLFYVNADGNVGTGLITAGKWYYVVCTWDETAGTARLYLNGVLKGTVAGQTTDDNFGTFYLGARTGTSPYWRGVIDDVRIYNRALRPDEVIAEQFVYNQKFNKVETHTDPLSNVTEYFYDSNTGDLEQVDLAEVDGQTPQMFYTYNARGQVETVTQLETEEEPNGIVTKYEYDNTYAWLKKTMVDFGDTSHLNIETTQDYYPNGDLKETTDARGNKTTFTYYNNRLPDITTMPVPFDNQTVDNDYDEDGNLRIKRTTGGALSQEVEYTYTPSGKKEWVEDPLDNRTMYDYDDLDRLSKVTDPEGAKANPEYYTEYIYYEDGKLGKIIDAKGNPSVTYTYDENGNVETLTDAKDNQTTYEYDAFGRLTKTVYPDDSNEQLTYDAAGNVLAKTTRAGDVITYDYDALGRLDTKTDTTSGRTIQYGYDLTGKLETVTDSAYGTTNYDYDNAGRLTSVTYPDGKGVAYEYDDAGNRTKLIYPDDESFIYLYDQLNRLTSIGKVIEDGVIIDGLANEWEFDEGEGQTAFDPIGHCDGNLCNGTAWITEGKYGNALSFDGTDDYVKIDSSIPSDITSNFTISLWVKPLAGHQIDTEGNTGTAGIDGQRYAFGPSYTADTGKAGIGISVGTNGISVYEHSYGYMPAILVWQGAVSSSEFTHIAVVYSNNRPSLYVNGDFKHQGVQSGKTVYAMRQSHRLIGGFVQYGCFHGDIDDVMIFSRSLSTGEIGDINNGSLADTELIASYKYDALGRRTKVTYTNNATIDYDYDLANRLNYIDNTLADANHRRYDYTYDDVGNRLTMAINGGNDHTYEYDEIYQLTSVDYPAGYPFADADFSYDAAANRDETMGYTSNNLNQYSNAAGVNCDYDDNGNLTAYGAETYGYDAENRLTSAAGASGNTTYAYDSTGRRVSKTVNGNVTKYVYDGSQVIAEYDGLGRLRRKFLYGTGIDEVIMLADLPQKTDLTDDGIVALEDLLVLAQNWLCESNYFDFEPDADLNGDGIINFEDYAILTGGWHTPGRQNGAYYYHYDGLGSVAALSNEAGQLVETYKYDVYGSFTIYNAENSVLSKSSVANTYLFTGREYDSETGNYYYRARYYNASTGRFLQSDPIGYKGGLNLYAYCGNNPIILVDPYGLCGRNSGFGAQAKQLMANTAQGLQDMAIGTVNFFTGSVGSVDELGFYRGMNTVIPAIPSPQWARDRYAKQDDFTYNGQKFFGSLAVTCGVSACLEAASAASVATATNEGVYEFAAASGKTYVGQSGNIASRLDSHIASGKLMNADISTVRTTGVLGGKTAREIAEQMRINELGGVGNLENIRNPIGPNRQFLLQGNGPR